MSSVAVTVPPTAPQGNDDEVRAQLQHAHLHIALHSGATVGGHELPPTGNLPGEARAAGVDFSTRGRRADEERDQLAAFAHRFRLAEYLSGQFADTLRLKNT